MFNYFDVDFNCFNGKIVSFSLNNEFDRLCGKLHVIKIDDVINAMGFPPNYKDIMYME